MRAIAVHTHKPLHISVARVQVYEGQCVGMHAKAGDIKINVCRTKQLTNMRA